MVRVLIGGDSWAVGEWGDYDRTEQQFPNKPAAITHLGLDQYLLDEGFEVFNVAHGGISNKNSIKYLSQRIYEHWDYVFWIQTDPLRNLRDSLQMQRPEYDSKWFEDYEDLIRIQDLLLKTDYSTLNSYAKKIYCIGGCSKLRLNVMQHYPNLDPIVPSFPELITPNFECWEVYCNDHWRIRIDERWDLETITQILVEHNKFDKMHYTSPFFTKGYGHPDRYGHKVLFDYLKTKLGF